MAFHHRAALRAFRIADSRHVVFDGTGAYLWGGRWTSVGYRVIYAAQTYAGALLEILVHYNLPGTPRNHEWVEISVPSSMSVEEVRTNDIPDWDGADRTITRNFGNRWCQEKRTAVLIVPSRVTSGVEYNMLLNQEHKDFHNISTGVPRDVNWDERLLDV